MAIPSNKHLYLTKLLAISAVFVMLMSACTPVTVSTTAPTTPPTATQPPVVETPTVEPTAIATQAPTATETEVAATQPPTTNAGELTLDYSQLASDLTVETIAAVPATSDSPIWGVLPEHKQVTLEGYPVAKHLLKPQIFVYPVTELGIFNEGAGKIASDLLALLTTKTPGDVLPFLPLFNAQQVLHAQTQFLQFKNGVGVRFLTQFDQAPIPINNDELFYTFQGLTTDGKFYVAVVLPVTHPDLPETGIVSTQQVGELNDFPAYIAKTATWLEGQPANSFTPDLAKLDAMVQSIEVR